MTFQPHFTGYRNSDGQELGIDGHGLSYKSDKGKGDLSRARIKREKITTIENEDQ